MSRKNKTLIIALGVLVLLGGGYYGSAVWKKKKSEAAFSGASSPKLGNLESSRLVKIEVPGFVLEKKDDVWELVSLDGLIPPGGIELDQNLIQSMTYSLANIWVERVVDEEPADLSVYGLDKPGKRTIVTDSDEKKAEYILGDMTPSRTAYYVMEEGDPRVYSVAAYSAENIWFALGKIRKKSLSPAFEFMSLTRLRLEKNGKLIDISAKPDPAPSYLISSFATHIMTSPYKLVRGTDTQALSQLLMPLKSLAVEEFVDDHPSSLVPYGLDKPVRFFLETNEGSVDLLIGNQVNGMHYAKLADAPGVFAVKGLEGVVNARPFSLVDKFAFLINIDLVDHLSISGGEREFSADFEGKEDDAVFFLNGKKAETKSFKNWYQVVVGLLVDAEIPVSSVVPGAPVPGTVTIEYRLNTPPGAQAVITLVPYDRDFYVLRQEGIAEFLVSRNQVRNIYKTADAIVFE